MSPSYRLIWLTLTLNISEKFDSQTERTLLFTWAKLDRTKRDNRNRSRCKRQPDELPQSDRRLDAKETPKWFPVDLQKKLASPKQKAHQFPLITGLIEDIYQQEASNERSPNEDYKKEPKVPKQEWSILEKILRIHLP